MRAWEHPAFTGAYDHLQSNYTGEPTALPGQLDLIDHLDQLTEGDEDDATA